MAYDEYDERGRGLDRGSELYDEDLYESQGFGEKLDHSSMAEEDDMQEADDTMNTDDTVADLDRMPESSAAEESFGESITSNPHLEDQLDDNRLSREAEADYPTETVTDTKDESLLDKAKDKFNELTGHDKNK